MRKGIIQKLTMLAFVAMVGIPAFAQGGKFGTNAGVATTIGEGHVAGDVFDLEELQYRVIDTETGLNLEVIGFASYISGATGDPTLLESKYAGTVTIPHYLDPADVDVAAHVSSVAANAFTTTVLYPTAPGNSADSKDQFAAAAAKVTKLEIDYSPTEITADIGANAFAGLTALTEVNNLTPGAKIAKIPVNSFDENVYKTASLIVPAEKMGKYASTQGWKEFYLVKDNEDGKILGNLNTDSKLTLADYSKLYSEIKTATKNGTSVTYSTYKDLNGDGKITLADYSLLYSIVKRNSN